MGDGPGTSVGDGSGIGCRIAGDELRERPCWLSLVSDVECRSGAGGRRWRR